MGLPSWTAIGVAEQDPRQLLAELISQRPPAPTASAEWIDTASWWGSVRSAAGDVPGDESVWGVWEELDRACTGRLDRSYGSSLRAAAGTRRGLHQIAPFLARRVEDGTRVLLVVIDGLGFAQGSRLRSPTGLHVEESAGCLAMIPTLTTISRQAIVAGALPVDYSDTLATTSDEPRRGAAFWAGQGLHQRDVSYTMERPGADQFGLSGMSRDITAWSWGESNCRRDSSVTPGQSVTALVGAGFRVTVVDRE
jgi:hypothetical protein